jgi:hypothetical protein
VRRASWAADVLDVTGDIRALELEESGLDAHGWIDLVNTGAYASADVVRPGNLVALSFGYETSAGAHASRVQDLWITSVERRADARAGAGTHRSIARLHLEGGLRRLRRSFQRHHVSHTGTDSYRTIMSAIMLRAGLALSVTTASARSQDVAPPFHITPDQPGAAAVRACLAHLADRIVPKANGIMALHEPLASETAVYALGDGAAHPLYQLRLVDAPAPVSETLVLALSGANAYITGQAFEHPAATFGLAPIERVRDLASDTAPEAGATATAHQRQRVLDGDGGYVVCPPVCGLELLDVVTVSHPLAGAAVTLRVRGVTWRLDRMRGLYEQRIGLGPR